MLRLLTSAALICFGTFAAAHDYVLGDITVKHPMSFATTGKAGAGYLEIINDGAADRLVGVEADFPKVMIHDTVLEDGIAKMQHLMGVDLPTGETVALKPRGMHVMFMGLSDGLSVGDKIPATLIFENAGRLDVTFNVEDRAAYQAEQEDVDHSNH